MRFCTFFGVRSREGLGRLVFRFTSNFTRKLHENSKVMNVIGRNKKTKQNIKVLRYTDQGD